MSSRTDRRYAPQHARPSGKPPWLRALLLIVAVLTGIAVVAAGTFGVLWLVGRSASRSQAPTRAIEDADVDENGDRLTYRGHVYEYNHDLTNMLFIGTDRKRNADTARDFGANGQADALYLAAVDTVTGKATVLAIPRDTMTDVRTYSVTGDYIGVQRMQVCLAFAYGDGGTLSCENTVRSVSELLYGVDIGTYFCMDWENIAQLNDLVGGVTVPEYDENWEKTGKTVTLRGEDAKDYLIRRDKSVLDSSINRLERQVHYLRSFSKTLTARTREDITVPLKFYNTLNSVSVNTLDASKITYLATVYLKGGAKVDFRTLKGTMTQGEQYAELTLDDRETYETILEIFYKKVK